MTAVTIKIKNPSNPKKIFRSKFLVDSGATYTVVPTFELKKIGIRPKGEEKFALADGRMVSRKIGHALFEYQGVERAAPVLFGEKGDSLLLGTFTLEALGLTLDPFKRKLYKAELRL